MNTNKLISSLCYFSIFFAGFIFPIAVYFIVDHHEVKEHAKKALLSHIVPFITIPIMIAVAIAAGEPSFLLMIFFFGVFGLINLFVFIWNIIKGVKLLID